MSHSNPDSTDDFIESLQDRGDAGRTVGAYRRVLGRFKKFVQSRGETVETATRADFKVWLDSLRGEMSEATVATYASYVSHFYRWRHSTGRAAENPMYEVCREMPEGISKDPNRREITVSEMRQFVAGISHPLDRAVVVTLLKTGMRVGELCNLDMVDIQWGDDRALRVADEIAVGETVRGEERTAANKRIRTTFIPIDAELERELQRWLLIRPDTRSPADPLFVSTAAEWGTRLTPSMVGSSVTEHAKSAGWYEAGGGEENVTPHYFRHFFTTWMRERVGETGSVAYLRGDAIQDGSAPYIHNWEDRGQRAYREHIYSIVESA